MKMCGFDGVDIHSLHWGYLWTAFAMSITNHRTDQYGGPLENRLRPLKEIVEGIKRDCGADFPVSVRVCLKTFISALNKSDYTGENEAGITLEEGVEICKALESYGYDLIMVDAGIYDSFYYAIPPMYIKKGYTLDLAKAVRKEIKTPLIVTGSRIDEPELIARVFSENIADGIAIGRPSLADPFLPKKYEMGKPEEVRPCIGCNTCIMTLLGGQNLHCAVNPTVVREGNVSLKTSLLPKNVIVVGGGIAGMEAARVLKLRGNTVTIYEKSNRLGGNLNAAGTHDFKHDVGRLNRWYQRQMEKLNIPGILNTELSAQDVIDKDPDAVILSTGSLPVSIQFEGNDSAKVISCLDAIYHEERIGDKVVIVGGGQIGCEIAMDLASKENRPRLWKHWTIF
jgi:2-enoate reductase